MQNQMPAFVLKENPFISSFRIKTQAEWIALMPWMGSWTLLVCVLMVQHMETLIFHAALLVISLCPAQIEHAGFPVLALSLVCRRAETEAGESEEEREASKWGVGKNYGGDWKRLLQPSPESGETEGVEGQRDGKLEELLGAESWRFRFSFGNPDLILLSPPGNKCLLCFSPLLQRGYVYRHLLGEKRRSLLQSAVRASFDVVGLLMGIYHWPETSSVHHCNHLEYSLRFYFYF